MHLYCDNINMDISVGCISANKLYSIQQAFNIKLLKGQLELQKDLAKQVMEAIKVPYIGQNIDIKV